MTSLSEGDHLSHMERGLRAIEVSKATDALLIPGRDLTEATLHRLQNVIESSKHLSDELKADHPEVPWREMVDFRNRLVHQFYGVKLDVVSDVLREDLPVLGQAVRRELALARQPVSDLGLGLGL